MFSKPIITFLLGLFSILWSFNLCAQQPEDTLLLRMAMKELPARTITIVYTDETDVSDYYSDGLSVIKYVRKDKKRTCYAFANRAEMRFLKIALQQQDDKVWPDNLFHAGQRISHDSLAVYLKTATVRYIEELNRAALSKDSLSVPKRSWVYSFSRPVFYRDGTRCLIYIRALCGMSAGSSSFLVYERVGGNWQKLCVLSQGDW